jgi:hypothetical protein
MWLLFYAQLLVKLLLLKSVESRLQDFRWNRFCTDLVLQFQFVLCLFFSNHPLYFTFTDWLRPQLVSNLKPKWLWHCNSVPAFALLLHRFIIRGLKSLTSEVPTLRLRANDPVIRVGTQQIIIIVVSIKIIVSLASITFGLGGLFLNLAI